LTRDYTDLTTWWHEYANDYAERSWREYRSLLGEVLQHASGGPLLDVGSGYGFLVECARRFGIDAIGLEGADEALEESRARHPLADVRAWRAGTEIPLTSESIGIAVANEFIDHITIEQNRALFRELWRVLKPDGVVIVKLPSRYNTDVQDKGHITFFSPSEFRRFVTSFGFEVIAQAYVPRQLLGHTRLGWFAMRMLAKMCQPESWSAHIDVVARRARSG